MPGVLEASHHLGVGRGDVRRPDPIESGRQTTTMMRIHAVTDKLAGLHRQEPVTAQRIEALLDVLEDDPGDSRVRRRSWVTSTSPAEQGPVWGFTVRGRDTDYLVLWRAAADGVVWRTKPCAVL